MKESVSMGQIDAAKGKYYHWWGEMKVLYESVVDGGKASGGRREEDVATTKSMSASQDITSDVRTRR